MEQNQSKVCIITGATSGIGKQTALALARQEFQLVLPTRNADKASAVVAELKNASKNQHISWMLCDLASLDSIRQFVEDFQHKYSRLDVLINNAGVWPTKYQTTVDGYELTFAVNVLAPFLLTNLLLGLLKRSEPSRIVNVASAAHYGTNSLSLDQINKLSYFGLRSAYQRSKVCDILFTSKLSEHLIQTKVTANCLHPGLVNTNLFDSMPFGIKWLLKLIEISPEAGARTSVYLATSPEVNGVTGKYFSNMHIAQPSTLAQKDDLAEALWRLCSQLVGLDN